MLIGFQFEVIYSDADLVQICVSAWNGSFGGIAELYEPLGTLGKAAVCLRGFPDSVKDVREITFGNFDRKFAGGGVSMRFHCIDGAGHAYVEAKIDSNFLTGGTTQNVVLAMPVEASAIDSFVKGLQRLETDHVGTAQLKGLASEGRY